MNWFEPQSRNYEWHKTHKNEITEKTDYARTCNDNEKNEKNNHKKMIEIILILRKGLQYTVIVTLGNYAKVLPVLSIYTYSGHTLGWIVSTDHY